MGKEKNICFNCDFALIGLLLSSRQFAATYVHACTQIHIGFLK